MSSKAELSRAYANGAFIPGSAALPELWLRQAAEFRASLGNRAETGITYGQGARNKFDLFRPEGEAKGLMVWVHGGWWLAFGRESWSHFAAGALARGWAVAMPSYTLAPEARIAAMTKEITAAVRAASNLVPGPLVVSGHSAGGHLSARMGCADIDLPGVRRVVPISPLAELEPLMGIDDNERLRIDMAEALAESPTRLARRQGCEAHVWVGGQERPTFLWQARVLSENWDCPWTVAPGLNHFTVIDDLTNPASALVETCVGGLG